MKSSEEYAKRVRQLIESFVWPYRLLQKLSLYERRWREVEQKLLGVLTRVSEMAEKMPLGVSLPEAAEQLRSALATRLAGAKKDHRYVSWPCLRPVYYELRQELDTAFTKYRIRRQELLQSANREFQYWEELKALGTEGSLPRDGVLDTDVRKAMAVV